jgi:hypothetical protein
MNPRVSHDLVVTGLSYCRPHSVRSGEEFSIHASAEGQPMGVRIVRDGLAPDVVWEQPNVAIDRHDIPHDAPEEGCRWPPKLTIDTKGWKAGLHLVHLRADGDDPGPAPTGYLVVRDPGRQRSPILLVLSTNTWNAYNDVGGRNFYTGSVVASFERPLGAGMLAKPDARGSRLADGVDAYVAYTGLSRFSIWHGMAGWAGPERSFVVWAEQNGIDLDYATNADLEADDQLLDGRALVLSVGHDEYWSWGMRDRIESFVAGGGNVAFLSGNTAYWQVRNEAARMIGYKHRFREDPVYGTDRQHLTTTMWSDPLLARPENHMTGVSFTRGGYARILQSVPRGSGGYEVHRPHHWLFEGTDLRRGDVLGGDAVVVGYECDGCDLALVGGLPVATGRDGTPAGFQVLATAPATPFDRHTTELPLAPGGEFELEFHAQRLLGDDSPENCDRLRSGHAVLGTYQARGTVVTVGCTDWAHGLRDLTVATITRNLVARLGTLTQRA